MPIPVAWMISDNTTTDTYERLFTCISAPSTKDGLSRFHPTIVLGDYDQAIQAAVSTVWPTTQYCGDYFHFLQANMRWFKKNTHEEETLLVKMLQVLWHSPTSSSFLINKDDFLRYWTINNTFYARYFVTTWIKRYPPVLWMKSGRGNAPSGDQILEGYNNRLKRTGKTIFSSVFIFSYMLVFYHRPVKVDMAVDLLAKECTHLEGIFYDEQQREAFVSERHTICTPPPSEETITELLGSEGKSVPEGETLQIEELPNEATETTAPAPLCTAPIFSLTASLPTHTEPGIGKNCLQCKRARLNKCCSNRMCRQCCKQSPKCCTVASHQSAKHQRVRPPYADAINSAITNHHLVYVAYDGGSTPGRTCTLQPKSWLTEWVSFRAIEHGELTPQEKTYRVDRISHCSQTPWE